VSDKNLLDMGCGDGDYARELSRRGAHVTGVDGSERLIHVARERAAAEGLKVRFVRANANAMSPVETSSFDLVLASMSLMDVEDYSGAIREANRVLRAGGELVMSITHPCFSAPLSEWVRDNNGELRYFAVDRYFDRMVWEEKITPAFRVPVLRRHRPLEDYIEPPLACGFILRQFQEPSATDLELKQSRRFRKLLRIPYFLFMRWQKS
jgi:ubiquinone/menaquinone biosynthesis C-methylase UbiE